MSFGTEDISGEFSSEAKGVSCLLLQRDILSFQAIHIEKYLVEAKDYQKSLKAQTITENAELYPAEEVLSNRMSSSESKEAKKSKLGPDDRVLDDTEITIMGILDADGKIAARMRLTEFMSLMTRITKVDHRVLCLHILQNCLSEPCQTYFVEDGGLRILKQWIKVAQEQTCINELKSILKLLKKLPPHMEQVKSSGIDSIFKTLKKWENGTLAKQVEAVKDAWSAQWTGGMTSSTLPLQSGNSVPLSEDLTLMTSAVQDKLIESRPKLVSPVSVIEPSASLEKEKTSTPALVAPVPVPVQVVSKSMDVVEAARIERPASKFMGMKVITVESANKQSEQKALPSPIAAHVPSAEPVEATSPSEKSSTTPLVTSGSADSVVHTARSSSKKVVDMGAIARQAQEKADAEAVVRAQQEEITKAEERAANNPKPGKGGLKRSHAEVTDSGDAAGIGPAARKIKVKRGIRWSDHENGQLREIKMVENWIPPVKGKGGKDDKDMQMRDKQMEKVTRMKQPFSMQKSCEWSLPSKLRLSLEIQENSHNPVDSAEKAKIEGYVATTPDASYPDVTLIPDDPDEPIPSSASAPTAVAVNVIPITFVNGPVGGQGANGHTANEDFFEPFGASESVAVTSSANGNLYASVPEQLHFLEPALLQLLVRDTQQIGAMLNFDGTVNHTMVQTFRQHALGLPPAPGSSLGNNPFTDKPLFLPQAPPMGLAIAPPRAAPPQQFNKQASIPCTWFNTPQGCHKGDSCVYGHFRKIK
jgi:hypothetical protein